MTVKRDRNFHVDEFYRSVALKVGFQSEKVFVLRTWRFLIGKWIDEYEGCIEYEMENKREKKNAFMVIVNAMLNKTFKHRRN